MRENEFEKRVREKMDQLGFEPSESVWIGVDKEINKEKKRRAPLFWLFFVSGLLLAGGAYYFNTNKNTTRIIPNKNTENQIAKIPVMETRSKKQTEQPLSRIMRGPTAAPQNAGDNRQPLSRKMRGSTAKPKQVTVASSLNQKTVAHARGISAGKKTVDAKTSVKSKETHDAGQVAAAAGAGDIVVNNYNNQSAKTDAEKSNKKIPDSTAGNMISSTTQNKTKKNSVAGATTAKMKEQKKKSSTWKIGYTAGLGSSNLNQNLFNSVKTLSPVNYATLNAPPVTNGGNNNNSSSEISPGFSFDAGAYVSRNLSKRLSFSAGINYHYYSTTIRTGIKINTTLVTSNSMGQLITATSYYDNGNSQTFTNQYHFIEIPLSVNFQINKSKRTPFIWELGLTPGYIVSSNALYYDPNTNVYFENYLQPKKYR
ncbi:MAG TPA: outer membrane beta-barrel protein [Puia sp.]|nr:outer membrane beta-barrel protein [Puia sp.]